MHLDCFNQQKKLKNGVSLWQMILFITWHNIERFKLGSIGVTNNLMQDILNEL